MTPEYNHGYPASLKNALDLLYSEWFSKPLGFASYGGFSGGLRAVAQLTLTAFLVPLGLLQILVGPLSDQVGRRRPCSSDSSGSPSPPSCAPSHRASAC